MNAYEEVIEKVQWVLDNYTSYRVAQALGINARTINRYQNGESPVENMKAETLGKIYNYYLKEMVNMERTQWEFEEYTVYDEGDVLRFENNNGDIIGYVSNHEGDLNEDLNNGADPIQDGWEDGVGNTINIDGWGNNEA